MKKLLLMLIVLSTSSQIVYAQYIVDDHPGFEPVSAENPYKPHRISNGTTDNSIEDIGVSTETLNTKVEEILREAPYFRQNYDLQTAGIKISRTPRNLMTFFPLNLIHGEEVTLTLTARRDHDEDSVKKGEKYQIKCDWYTHKQDLGGVNDRKERFELKLKCYERKNITLENDERKDPNFKKDGESPKRTFITYWDETPGQEVALDLGVDDSSRFLIKERPSQNAIRSLTQQTVI